jgi:hypothetical protein
MTLHEWDNDGQVAVAYPSPPLSPHQIYSPARTSLLRPGRTLAPTKPESLSGFRSSCCR